MRRRPTIPVLVLTVTFVAIFLVPFPDLDMAAKLAMLFEPRAKHAVIEVGNSVVTAVSSCDRDKRDLSAVLGEDLGRTALDLSNPGQEFEKSLNFATIALKHSQSNGAIFYLSSFEMTQHTLPNLQTGIFLRLASSSEYHANSMKARMAERSPLGSRDREDYPFEYGGISYPRYQGLKDIYYTVEASQTKCPEDMGINRRFIEALYWKAYMQQPIRKDHLTDLAILGRSARAMHKPLLVVLLPVDSEDVSALNPSLGAAIRQRAHSVADSLRVSGLEVLDLSQILPPDLFVGRWCACGHLTEGGRKIVAEQTALRYRTLANNELQRANY